MKHSFPNIPGIKRVPWSIAADIAASVIGERETEGKNRSPFILRVWKDSGIGEWGYKHEQPWCCAFVVWAIVSASLVDRRLALPQGMRTASVATFDERAERRCIKVRWQNARKGDVVSFLPKLSHIGIVEEVTAAGLVTIEGNTNEEGSREGHGVFRRQRPSSIIGSVWALPVSIGV